MGLINAMVVVLALVAVSWADKAGVKVRITNSGLDLAVQTAVKTMVKKVDAGSIVLGNNGLLLDKSAAKIEDAKLTELSFGLTSLRTSGNKVRLHVKKGGATITARGTIRVGWLKKKMNLKLVLSRVELILEVTIDSIQGMPAIKATKCHLPNMKIGGLGSLLDAVVNTGILRKTLADEACKNLKKFLNGPLNDDIRKTTARAKIGRIEVDYGFSGSPSYGANYLDVYQTGDVYWKGKKIVAHSMSAMFPASKHASKMVYLWLSEAVFNNMFYTAYKNNVLQKTITESVTKKMMKDSLGGFSGFISSLLDKSSVKILIKTSAPPTLSFTSSGASMKIRSDVIMDLSVLQQSLTHTLSMDVNVDANLKLAGKKITTEIRSMKTKLHHNTAFDLASLERVIENVGVDFLKKKLSAFTLPLPNYVMLKNGAITPMKGFIKIEADGEIRV